MSKPDEGQRSVGAPGVDVQTDVAELSVPVETVFDYLDAAVVVLDSEGNVVVWNRRCAELVGHSKREAAQILEREGVLGPAWYHDGRRSMLLAEKVVDAPERADVEYGITKVDDVDFTLYGDTSSFVDAEGEERHIEFTAAPIYDDAGALAAVIELVQIDMETERERQLNSLVAEMQRSMQAVEAGDLGARVDLAGRSTSKTNCCRSSTRSTR